MATSGRRQSTDTYHDRQRLQQSNGHHPDSNERIRLGNGRKIATIKISTSCADSTRSGNEYLTRITHSRLSTPTASFDYISSTGQGSHNRQTISQRTTKMLVICSTTFLIFNSPYSAVLFYSIVSKQVLTRPLDILRHFYFMSFCLNFFLYSLCGNRFRHELIVLLKRICGRCCSRSFRQQWFNVDKISSQSSTSRTTARSGI